VPGRLADVSSLWTPDGEHPVGRDEPRAAPTTAASGATRSTAPPSRGPAAPGDGPGGADDAAGEEEIRASIDEARARLLEVPAEVIVLNHAMGLYELGAIHLSATPPNLADAAVAIDAFGCIVEGLGERLGPDAPTLRDALGQIRLAFVQVKGAVGEPAPPADD